MNLIEELNKRLKNARTELSDARDAFGYTGAGGYVAHAEGRIEELESLLKLAKATGAKATGKEKGGKA